MEKEFNDNHAALDAARRLIEVPTIAPPVVASQPLPLEVLRARLAAVEVRVAALERAVEIIERALTRRTG